MSSYFPAPLCGSTQDCWKAISNANVICDTSVGLCACSSDYGLSGAPDCLDSTAASLGTRIALGVSLALTIVTVVRFAYNLARALYYKRWIFEPAGVSFALTWFALVGMLVTCAGRFAQAYEWSQSLAIMTEAAFIATVVFLLPAVLLMEATFVDATRLVPKFNSKKKMFQIVLVPLVGLLVLGAALAALLPALAMAWQLTVAIVFSALTVTSVMAPSFLYVRMAHLLFVNNHRQAPPVSVLIKAIASEVFCGTRAMKRAMGLYDDDSDWEDDGSKDSKSHNSKPSDPGGRLSKRLSKLLRPPSRKELQPAHDIIVNTHGAAPSDFPESSKLRKFFLGNNDQQRTFQARQRDNNTIRFLSRATRMSFNLALSLLFFSCFSFALFAWMYAAPAVDLAPDVSRIAVFYAGADICLTLAMYRLLWFLNKKYVFLSALSLSLARSLAFVHLYFI